MKSVDEQIKDVLQNKVYNVQANLVRETAMRVLGNLTKTTPVDTGRARANWNMSVGTPDMSTTENTGAPDSDATADEVLSGYQGNKAVYVSNGLPYIIRLNEGHSKQAPANFVEESVMLAKRQAEAAAKRGLK